jgi:hypothetical protein
VWAPNVHDGWCRDRVAVAGGVLPLNTLRRQAIILEKSGARVLCMVEEFLGTLPRLLDDALGRGEAAVRKL